MKSDEDVRMIRAEAPVLFAKACELFILELTLRAYCNSENTDRRNLQKEDIFAAVKNTDIFDFLDDVLTEKVQLEQSECRVQHSRRAERLLLRRFAPGAGWGGEMQAGGCIPYAKRTLGGRSGANLCIVRWNVLKSLAFPRNKRRDVRNHVDSGVRIGGKSFC